MNSTFLPDPTAPLAERWKALREASPSMRIREAAIELGVSEAELLATQMADGKVARLLPASWPDLLEAFTTLGRVMCLTRNDGCVLEHKGTFDSVEITRAPHGDMATVIGPIELRVFFKHWGFAFAVESVGQNGKPMHSIQVFDVSGTAILKVYLQHDGNPDAYAALVARFRAPEQAAELALQPVPALKTVPLAEIDRPAFLAEWAALQDTHDYFGMLRKHKADRLDAMHLAEGTFTRCIAIAALEDMLLRVAAEPRLPIMIFAGNKGNIQIHQDEVRHIKTMGPWLNVLDPHFNMHLRTDSLATAWAVQKPTRDGVVTSIECFDATGELIVQFFGLRKPGLPEREDWRALVAELPSDSVLA